MLRIVTFQCIFYNCKTYHFIGAATDNIFILDASAARFMTAPRSYFAYIHPFWFPPNFTTLISFINFIHGKYFYSIYIDSVFTEQKNIHFYHNISALNILLLRNYIGVCTSIGTTSFPYKR